MKITINPKIFEDFDNPRIGIVVVENADNSIKINLEKEFISLSSEIVQKYGDQTISEIPKIAAWRDAYRKFGAKPKDYPSSIESLLRRAVKGNGFWGISPLVDISNYISLKHLLPLGGEDIDKISGDMKLTYAAAHEKPVLVLGKDSYESPKEGEVIYKDSEGTMCRRWNWREVSRTVLTEKTKNCVIVFEALNPVSDEELECAQAELGELIVEHCAAQVQNYILTAGTPSIDI